MIMSEFIDRTGFEPTAGEYAKIEEAYYEFDGDKDAFCKAFVKDGGEQKICKARAARIAELESEAMDNAKAHQATVAGLQRKIDELQKALDRELEWKPCDGGTTMDQGRYEHLASAGKVMSEQEAAELIADECGFSPDKIRIITQVSTYEANKYHQMRKSNTYTRQPVYCSTDWNYVRFDCASFMYELVNGELQFYCC